MAEKESPVINSTFVVKNWGDKTTAIEINGKEVKRGEDFRFGRRNSLKTYDLIVWLRAESTEPRKISL